MAFVPSASAFSLPLPQWQQLPSRRVARYESKKRKSQYDTGEDESDSHDDGNGGETTDAVSDSGFTNPSEFLSQEEADQYRVAGLSSHEELPCGNFPHGPAKEKYRRVNNRRSLHKELSALSTPIYVPQSPAHQGNLRIHHLAVLTSVLHRCLLDGDYIRAGRAWGLLLREQFGGSFIDVRNEDRWGIGAEILLRKDRQMSDRLRNAGGVDAGGRMGSTSPPKLLFTRKGFEDAKVYYETLIINHPYQKTAPNAISALHFYPAMYGLWIYVTQEESSAARRALDERDPSSSKEWDDEDAESGNNGQKEHRRLRAEIRANELTEATRIAASMDGIIISPPYSDSAELLELRGMVSHWIADLLVSSLPSGISDDDDDDDDSRDLSTIGDDDGGGGDDAFMSTSLPDKIQARQERHEAQSKRQQELATSQNFMDKAQQRRQGVSSRLEGLHIGDDTTKWF